MSSPPTSAPVSGAPQPGFDLRSVAGLFGILLAAMMAGLNGRLPGLVPVDIQGGLGFGRDEAAWITTAYSAGELAAMPFASWFAITFSMRRFHLTMLAISLTLSVILPLVQDLRLLLALRVLQGIASGSLIPILMMALLRFLPLPIRLYGLAIFALTATFTPNVALWLAAWCVDHLEDWRWLYWNVIPLGLAAMALVVRGVPNAPPMLERLKQANWLGMALGMPGLALLVAGIDQGVRLDWFNSPSIIVALGAGVVLTALFLLGESLHPLPFIQLQLLQRRNVWLGLLILICLFMLFASGVSLPANVLGHMQGFRMPQSAKLGLIVGLPQLALGPCVALLLYRRWVDARHVFAMGLSFIALACWLASGITGEWMVPQFFWPQVLQAMGQAMAVVSSLFLVTSVIQPMEGPFIAGFINILRVISTTLASAGIGQFTAIRGRFHSEMLLDNAGHLLPRLASPDSVLGTLGQTVFQQASILAAADVYRAFAVLALLMIPAVLNLKRIHPPAAHPPQAVPSVAPASVTP